MISYPCTVALVLWLVYSSTVAINGKQEQDGTKMRRHGGVVGDDNGLLLILGQEEDDDDERRRRIREGRELVSNALQRQQLLSLSNFVTLSFSRTSSSLLPILSDYVTMTMLSCHSMMYPM